ncbi:MAG TPA: Uma2 family endonuclease [Candidatus Binatia bacterium]|nr:Uma2 family endonuclease [Candidatus Binatia bacterium]
MATEQTKSEMTAEELFSLPDDGWRYQLVRGELRRMPPTGMQHGQIAGLLTQQLTTYVRTHDLGVVFTAEAGYRLAQHPDTVRAPDVSFVARERIPAEGVPTGYWPGAPDLAVEIVSPSDRFDDVVEKVAEYLAAGTRLVWVIHPRTHTVMVYRATGEVQLLRGHEELGGEGVLPGFTCPVSALFE